MNIEERMKLVRLIDKMNQYPDYSKKLVLINTSRIKNGDREYKSKVE